ncbi:PREDICTED: ADP-ribosylation factor-like protein 13B isoform X2 [Amphimedon queenslandica]|uniref:ADP-ribosylation factor-like protein 13B n=1 Tax=Amphimedon queenslandica TaxID=400682 RepID=A0AAN0JEM9_AMPQE|nr:PREDICTED: ADP-ribosylation factor-like protein 13B isoform X2 [Amphimedon queenslandica]|eukprot:XP_019855231.1 PREDICTED: ADP-ribosylation factor-like protein 13B isoform X2 [Amphimedon queenslandica]
MGNSLKSRRDITITLLGLDGAGKSSLLQILTDDEENTAPLPTIGYTTRKIRKGRYNILLAEVGGGVDIRSIWPKYYAQCHAIIYMIDGSSNREKLHESKEELHKVLLDNRMIGKPLLVICNKTDNENCVSPTELVNLLDLSSILQESINNGLWQCSCLRNNSRRMDRRINHAMKWLLERVSNEWNTLSVRVNEQHESELKEKELAKQARIEERKRRREEEERVERETVESVKGNHDKQDDDNNGIITVTAEIEPVNEVLVKDLTSTTDRSSDNLIATVSSESVHSKNEKIKTAKILRKVKRNKLVPINHDPVDPSSFSSKPPLLSPWVTNGEHVHTGTIKTLTANADTLVQTHKLIPIGNHHPNTNDSFTAPQDVFLHSPAEY